MKKLCFVLFFIFSVLPIFSKSKQKIVPGQYVYADGELYLRKTILPRYDKYPIAPLLQPIANLGLTNSFITAITSNAAGKWQVVFRVESDKGAYDVLYQIAEGDIWTLYLVNPQFQMAPASEIHLKVNKIKNNEVEVEIQDIQ